MTELIPANAQGAMSLIQSKYGQYLATPLPDLSSYKFYKEKEGFETVFHSIYTKTFRTANLTIFGTAKITANQINGFVTPDNPPSNRIIYLNLDGAGDFGTLVHETIHALSHSNFYPTYYCTGGAAPAIVEGITEYLTRKSHPLVDMRRSSYQDWYDETEAWVGTEGSARYVAMVNWIFRGIQPVTWSPNFP